MRRYMIGEIAKITGLSAHTLRYYEKHNLIMPSYVDEETNYRYYSASDVEKIEILKECKKMDLTLEQIRRVIEAGTNDEIIRIIDDKQKEVEEQIEHYKVVEKNIRWYRNEYENNFKKKRACYQPFIQHIEKRNVIYRENPYEESSSFIALAEIAQKQLEMMDIVSKRNGFIADTKCWEEETGLRVKGEYIDLHIEDYEYTNHKYVYSIPGGTYLCMNIAHDASLGDGEVNVDTIPELQLLRDYIMAHNYIPKMVIVESYARSLKIFERVRCQVQILLEVHEDV